MKITVALAGRPVASLVLDGVNVNGLTEEDFERPYEDRPKVEVEVAHGDTLRAALQQAAEHWRVEASGARPIDAVAAIDFYAPGRSPTIRRQLPVLDAEGHVRWIEDWKGLSFRELVAAGEAKVLPGDPLRPYLLLDRGGYGNGLLVDWQTLAAAWEAFWCVLEKVATIGGAYAAKEAIMRRLRERSKDAPQTVRSHYQEWQERGARPLNVDELLGQRPWHADDFADRFGCTSDEAHAFLLGAGYAQDAQGLYRRGEDPEAELLHGNFELLIHTAMLTERKAVEDVLRSRVKQFLSSGTAPPLDWNKLAYLRHDNVGFRDPEQVAEAERAAAPSAARRLWWRVRYSRLFRPPWR